MIEKFLKQMARIRAEEELKEKTIIYVLSALEEGRPAVTKQATENKPAGRNILYRRLLAFTAAVAACLIIALGGYAFYITPAGYISLDINPSIELSVNSFERVIGAEGLNEDGRNLLRELKVMHRPAEEVLITLVRKAVSMEYISDNRLSAVALNTQLADEKKAAVLQARLGTAVRHLVEAGEIEAVVISDTATLRQREEARTMGLSTGRYMLMHYLQVLDPAVTGDACRNMSFTEMITVASQLAVRFEGGGCRPGGEGFDKTHETVMNAVREIEERNTQEKGEAGNMYQEMPDARPVQIQAVDELPEVQASPVKYQRENSKKEGGANK